MTEKAALYAISSCELWDVAERRPVGYCPEIGYAFESSERASPYSGIFKHFETYEPMTGKPAYLEAETLELESLVAGEHVPVFAEWSEPSVSGRTSTWRGESSAFLTEVLLKLYRERPRLLGRKNPYLEIVKESIKRKVWLLVRLEEILSKEGMLTLDDLKFIVNKVLPQIDDLPDSYVEELEHRLRIDAKRKLEEYGRWLDEQGLVWASIYDPEEFLREKNLSKLTPAERVKELLKAEMIMERSKDIATLALEVFNGERGASDALKILFKKSYCLKRLGLL